MVKGRRNPDDKLKNIEDEVDRLIRRREKSKETMPEVLYVPEGKKRKEEYIKPEFVPKPKTKKKRIFKKTDFLRTGIAKPVAIILVISMILTGIQLVSLISTGETIIVPSDFGIPEEFENAKQEFEAESVEVKREAEDSLNNVNWSVEKIPERDIIYDKSLISKEKPEWPEIFEDIEKANIILQPSYGFWTHTTNTDFDNNCSDKKNVVISGNMIKLSTVGVGSFISKPLDSETDNAVLKNVVWNPPTQPGASQMVIIVEVSQTAEDGTWIPVWKSMDVIPYEIKVLFPDMGEFATEVVSGQYFRYLVGFSGGLLGKPQLEDITIQVATATVDRKYYTFTYYNDNLEVDKDGVAGGNVTQLGLTIPEYNPIDVDPASWDGDDIIVISKSIIFPVYSGSCNL
ncbi:MAG: hypothetical protein KJ886_01020, partial [Candidatus Thermoplasmatota archaeon]|nr:hypothetical protein [Candidatus Thermoplasmatota archaeon]